MSSARSIGLLLLCAAVAAMGGALVFASVTLPAQSESAPLVMPRGTMSMDQAVRMVEERYHARVVKAETEHDAGRTLYVLRLLNDAGKVWTVRVDAASGSTQ
jgi:uncharacterized membrane protein YkoI